MSVPTPKLIPIVPMLACDAMPGLWRPGFLASEKLDGVRCVWDGRRLRTREGLAIACPAWFTEGLGPDMLDGELHGPYGSFDRTSGIIRRQVADEEAWREIRFAVFDLYRGRGEFARRLRCVRSLVPKSGHVYALPHRPLTRFAEAEKLMDRIVREGGEGVVLRDPEGPYEAGPSIGMVRLKPAYDVDAIVIGYHAGEGRLSDVVGSLECVLPGQSARFDVGAGLTDALRADPPRIGEVIIVRHAGLTPNRLPRQPVFAGIRAEQREDNKRMLRPPVCRGPRGRRAPGIEQMPGVLRRVAVATN